jgi:mannose/fructose/N-acetylgalactosamine-specific phosphotransferase system component IIC
VKRILHLGIDDPLRRVLVWLAGCAGCTLAGALLGAVGFAAVLSVLIVAVVGKLPA